MNWGSPVFVIAIVAISTCGWLINNWIRARHGYALENEWSGMTEKSGPETETLRRENQALRDQLDHFADRVQVLERIVTDKGYVVAAQIEALRPDAQHEKDAD